MRRQQQNHRKHHHKGGGFREDSQKKDDNTIKVTGTVTKIHGSMYEVAEERSGFKILATLCGKMKMHSIRIAIGDRVEMELSEYDLTKGRITYRCR